LYDCGEEEIEEEIEEKKKRLRKLVIESERLLWR
jgi:hypothetical protein